MGDYEYTPLYYPDKTNVKWYNKEKKVYEYGVGYKEYLYTEDGDKRLLDEVVKSAADVMFWDDVIIEIV